MAKVDRTATEATSSVGVCILAIRYMGYAYCWEREVGGWKVSFKIWDLKSAMRLLDCLATQH